MPDKGIGWRRKIHSKPKDIKTSSTTSSRPETPIRVGTPTLSVETEDAKSESSEPSTPRRPPTLARLVSGYRTLKDTSKEPEFAEPWSDDAPPCLTTHTDPLASMQSIYIHMNAIPTRPIPVDCNSALFHIFEDYRRSRAEKEDLEALLQETFETLRETEEALVETENQHKAEIRRLELIMMRGGVSSLEGLMRVRQDSVVKRKRTRPKTVSAERLQTTLEEVPMNELDEQIQSRSQKVLLQRPSSPSGKMVALSRKLSKAEYADDLYIGIAPIQETRVSLSRRVKSELDLSSIAEMATSSPTSPLIELDLPRESNPAVNDSNPPPVAMNPGIECEAVVALQELGTLVARKKGIDNSQFVNGLMQLLMLNEHTVENDQETEASNSSQERPDSQRSEDEIEVDQQLTPKNRLRASRSTPHLEPERRRRRHFSFEPGDDTIKQLESDLHAHGTTQRTSSSEVTESDPCRQQLAPTPLKRQQSNDFQKPSKIPSPLQRPGIGSIRRENSFPVVQHEDRRTSNSSVLTAFRQNSSGSGPATSRNENNSVAAIAAARAARSSGMIKSENEHPGEDSKDHA